MTIRDMLNDGIGFQGRVLVKEYNSRLDKFDRMISLAFISKDDDDLFDEEIKYIYPIEECNGYTNCQYCIEVIKEAQ